MTTQDQQLIHLKKDEYAVKKGYKDWAELITDLFFTGKNKELNDHLAEVLKEVKKSKMN